MNADGLIFWDTKNRTTGPGQKIAEKSRWARSFNRVFTRSTAPIPVRSDIDLSDAAINLSARRRRRTLAGAGPANQGRHESCQNGATKRATAALRDVLTEFVPYNPSPPQRPNNALPTPPTQCVNTQNAVAVRERPTGPCAKPPEEPASCLAKWVETFAKGAPISSWQLEFCTSSDSACGRCGSR